MQLFDPKPIRFKRIVAVRQTRIVPGDRARQHIDNLVFDAVGNVPAAHRAHEATFLVFDLFIFSDGVEDQRKHPHPRFQAGGQRNASGFANAWVTVGHAVQHVSDGDLRTLERKPQVGHGLIEQARPGRAAGNGFLMQKLLKFVGQHVRAHQTLTFNPRPIAFECLRRLILFRQCCVFDSVQFQRKEQHHTSDIVHPFRRHLVELGNFGIIRARRVQ